MKNLEKKVLSPRDLLMLHCTQLPSKIIIFLCCSFLFFSFFFLFFLFFSFFFFSACFSQCSRYFTSVLPASEGYRSSSAVSMKISVITRATDEKMKRLFLRYPLA